MTACIKSHAAAPKVVLRNFSLPPDCVGPDYLTQDEFDTKKSILMDGAWIVYFGEQAVVTSEEEGQVGEEEEYGAHQDFYGDDGYDHGEW
ncbi:hypothetical protein BGZ46_008635 [Entomortierella lignicola]|nr:hypothetical protein BGZ46_008635 [Entomortierella lignicola]